MKSLQDALVQANIAKPLKTRPKEAKVIGKCRKCGAPMMTVPNTNIAVCTGDKCKGKNNFIIFD